MIYIKIYTYYYLEDLCPTSPYFRTWDLCRPKHHPKLWVVLSTLVRGKRP